ncbi:MAG: bifunctional methylenetetrahydrofolate dehydrogenase/methenyltetrahydrofolate cyclohydrolase [Candidatus Lokiarchaeota archaeon]|jgi:methylenetetrahydrofolate dehydrogenase (NADP+)/methenyltetrahydrofolate cyclohydrolase|nr:bifunctional methylenetetrahydrofolate dehydrogenase/methenyltetrahydrofolate cyclohydrolase [Candidatus Lokiarchaeota archaeon]
MSLDFTPDCFCDGKVIDGRALSKQIRGKIEEEVERLTELHQLRPKLTTILVGDDAASKKYIKYKQKACKNVGILSENFNLPGDIQEDELIEKIEELNQDNKVHGILVQLPLPRHIDKENIIGAIDPDKDVDGFAPRNIYRLFHGGEMLAAATPQGIVTMLDHLDVKLKGLQAVVINRSIIVGKPLIFLLLNRDLTVSVCHSKTEDLKRHTTNADVLITAVGLRESKEDPYFITADMVKEGVVVIDVASPYGDCDFDEVKKKAKYITPVPGGVGPMTITMLLKNVLTAYAYQTAQANVLATDAIDYGSYTT